MLYGHTQKRKEDDQRFNAIVHGAKIKPKDEIAKEDLTVFKNPKDYEHLSDVERKELTEKMIGKHMSMGLMESKHGSR